MSSRNSPCPCGSGRRFKHCCGAAAAGAAAVGAAPAPPPAAGTPQGLGALLNHALQLQRAGRFDEADRLYTQALAIEPRHFDALHMGGVVAYQKNDFVRARRLIEAALEVQPHSVDAMMNMELVQRAFAADNEFDRYTLAHLPRYCRVGESDGVVSAAQLCALFGAADVHLVLPAVGARAPVRRFVQALVAQAAQMQPMTACAPRVHCWSMQAAEPIEGMPVPRIVEPGAPAPTGYLVVAGSDADAAAWADADGWAGRWLFCDTPAHGALADRLRRLSAHGRHRIELLFDSAALARRLRLPGRVFAENR